MMTPRHLVRSTVWFPHRPLIMADGSVSTSSDNGSLENTTVELFSIKHDGPELENLLLKGERLIWTSDLETLKKFVEDCSATREMVVTGRSNEDL